MIQKIIFLIIFCMLTIPVFYLITPQVNAITQSEHIPNEVKIKVGIHNNLGFPFTGATPNKVYNALWNSEWTFGDTTYRFILDGNPNRYTKTAHLLDYSILNKYDVLVMVGTQNEMIWSYLETEKSDKVKENLEQFIKDGGGYFGTCGGGSFPIKYGGNDDPITWAELIFHKNSFLTNDKLKVTWIGNTGAPYFDERRYWDGKIPRRLDEKDSSRIGAAAYLNFGGLNTIDEHSYRGSCPELVLTDKTHPIFNDFEGDTWRVGYWGGCGFDLGNEEPEDIHVKGLAFYPTEFLETDKSTDIHVWESDLNSLKHMEKFVKLIGCIIEGIDFKGGAILQWLHENTDWKKTTDYITPELYDKYAMISFTYLDNEDKDAGKVLLTGAHPELPIWTGGSIQEVVDDENNNLWNGLYEWEDTSDLDLYANEWFICRAVAWVYGLEENKLPPILKEGEGSRVVNTGSELHESDTITLNCCVGKNSSKNWDSQNLTLWYKYNGSDSNYTMTDWIEYGSVYNYPYEFEFNTSYANGTGNYYFCSILNTTLNGNYTCEEFPSEFDTWCMAEGNISADFSYNSGNLNDNIEITFEDLSEKCANSQFVNWTWNFGDGTVAYSQNETHQYLDNGTYTISLNVSVLTLTDNLTSWDNISKTIIVKNVRPDVDFQPSNIVVKVGNTVNFTDNSSDVDGTINNWFWTFGDGCNSSDRNSSHSYNQSGFYPVSLKVTDNDNVVSDRGIVVLIMNSIVNTSSNQSSINKTWNTIQDAIDNATTGDYIYIENGTYIENLTINKSINLIGQDKNSVIIKGSVVMNSPYDYEIPDIDDLDVVTNLSGIELVMHLNNDSSVGENYSSSALVYDYSGLGNNGTYYGATWINNTLKGAGAFDFDGIDDSLNLSNISALAGVNVTVFAWIDWNNGSGFENPIVAQYNSSDYGYCLYINSTTDKPAFRLNDTEAIASSGITTGWHNIVGTHNETTLKIYVDSVLKGSATKTGCGISKQAFIGFDDVNEYFNGTIDEVAVWNRTLSKDEISRIYFGNYGVYMEKFTIMDANISITVCNRSGIYDCILINNTVGVLLNNTCDVCIYLCNFSNMGTGISINGSNPKDYELNRIVFCNMENVSNGIIANSSDNISVSGFLISNTSNLNLSFTSCDFDSVYINHSDSLNNIAPDTPSLSGPATGNPNTSYTYYSNTNDSNNDQILYRFDWGDGNNTGWLSLFSSNETVNASHTWENHGGYYVNVTAKDVFNNESNLATILFKTETLPPLINSVNYTPELVGFGGNINITVNATDNQSGNSTGIKFVKVNVSFPNNTSENITMNFTGNNTYELNFSNTWLVGQYNFTIWVVDNAYNVNSSTGYCFNVSANATISVCPLQDEYGDDELILLTDPPGGSSSLLGYEFLDNGDVLHIWNKYDSYYFDTDSGIQLTNHYNEYWSHNVLMLGYYNNNQWNLMYRTDELSGFNKEIDTDNDTYINVTMWKNLEYYGYDFRLAIRYYLGVDDNELTVIPFIKNIDQCDIPYVLGFGWEMKDIQIDMTETGDYIDVNGTQYYLNQTLNNTYTDLSESEFYLMENITEVHTKSLYLKWNDSLTYKLQVKSRDNQYNAPVTLFVRIGTLDSGQEKYTKMYWYDADQKTYYFNSYDFRETWTNNPSYMVDGSTSNYASTSTDSMVELCNGNTCPGTNLGNISKVEIRVHCYYSGQPRDIILRPVIGGTTDGSNYNHQAAASQGTWSPWFDITGEKPSQWLWADIVNLDCDVEAGTGLIGFTLYASKVELRVTYNTEPSISNPVPAHGSTNVSTTPSLNITVTDNNGDLMDITWYTNSSTSTLTLRPNANGSITQLSRYPSEFSGNFQCVDETSYNDSDCVKWNGTVWKKDTYELANHSGETGVINFIKVYARCARVGSVELPITWSNANISLKTNGSYYYGKAFKPTYNASLPAIYSNYSHIWTFNPATGSAWTWNDIDNLEAGIAFIGNEGDSRCSQLYVEVNYTNSSLPWTVFATNNSVSNGTYRQTFTNASMNGKWWYWKVLVHDGTSGINSSVYKFYTGCESKIENTGSTNISGYLLIQVQYYNITNSTWVVADDTVNETTRRYINSGEELGLDTVFNGLVDTQDISEYGNGTYRIYAAFRDPDGNVLVCNDNTELKATYEFTMTFE